MASVFSVGVSKIAPIGFLSRLCKISQNHNVIQVAFMKRISIRDPVEKAPGFPYWDKYSTGLQLAKSSVLNTYDENTRIIVVDGPPAAGKTKLCEYLAEQFGLLYMPAPVHDEIYMNPYNFDLRQLDSKLPHHCQSYDLEKFLANPNDTRVPFFQINYFLMRIEQYLNAMLHVLSTGQGIVLNRCVYSDIAFVNAMQNAGYLSKEVVSVYMRMRYIGLKELCRPHMIIYLDVPPELVKEKIKKRGNPHEINSKVFTTKFLSDLKSEYIESYLKVLKQHSEVLIYDWSNEGNLEDVVYDVENVDLDTFKKPRLADWIFDGPSQIYDKIEFCQIKHISLDLTYIEQSSLPRALYWTADEADIYENIVENNPYEKYLYGFHPEFDKNLFFKRQKPILHFLRRTPRDFINREAAKS